MNVNIEQEKLTFFVKKMLIFAAFCGISHFAKRNISNRRKRSIELRKAQYIDGITKKPGRYARAALDIAARRNAAPGVARYVAARQGPSRGEIPFFRAFLYAILLQNAKRYGIV